MKYDLEERTAEFGEKALKFLKELPRTPILNPLISQLARSSTSVGANYCEADGAESKKDFIHKISICKKELKETKHWLRMIKVAEPNSTLRINELWREAQELTLIFSKIIINSKNNTDK